MNDVMKRLFGKGRQRPKPMPRSTVEHDSVDEMVFGNYSDDSPRFRKLAIEDRPRVTPDTQPPPMPDAASAAPEEMLEWQEKVKKAREAEANAPEYDAWEDLTRDIFYTYHHPNEPEVVDMARVDPAVRHHAKIASKMIHEDDHALARNITRDDPIPAAMATMAAVNVLKDALQDELADQARQSEDFEQARDRTEGAIEGLESLRDQARELHEQGQPIPADLKSDIHDAVLDKRSAMSKVEAIVDGTPVPMDKAGHDAIVRAVQEAAKAAKSARSLPGFGQGFGDGEPRYESPEQALTIADM